MANQQISMKHIFLFFLSILFFQTPLVCQSLKAQMKYVFIDEEAVGKYTGGIKIESGSISIGDILRPTDEAGVEFVFKVIEIKDYDLDIAVKTLGSGKEGFFVLQTLDKKRLVKNPHGSFRFGAIKSDDKIENQTNAIGTACVMDGYAWNGNSYYRSSTYFPKGNPLVKTTNPYLILSFKTAQSPDDRQMTLIHKEAKVGVGLLDKMNYELVVSGSKDGIPANACLISNWKDGVANTQKTDFYFEITKFEDKGDHIILSAKYAGKLFGLNLFKSIIGASCQDVVVKEGVIHNLKVEKQ